MANSSQATAAKTAEEIKGMTKEQFSGFVIDGLDAGYEAKDIDGTLRLKRYQRQDGIEYVNEIKLNPENFHLELTMKKDRKIEVQSTGSAQAWAETPGETFDDKLQNIMKQSIGRAAQIAKLQSMDEESFNALIEKAEAMKKEPKKAPKTDKK